MCLAAVLALAVAATPQSQPEPDVALAVRLAGRHLPSVTWRVQEARVGDFTFDGTPDVGLLGEEEGGVVVAVVVGPVGDTSTVLYLRLAEAAPGESEGICGKAADTHIDIDTPGIPKSCDGSDCRRLTRHLAAAAKKGGKALSLSNGTCEKIRVFFDGKGLRWLNG